MPYTAPIKDMLFDMQHLAQLDTLVQDIPVFADATLDTARSILEEAARFHQEVTAPLNHSGDAAPASWKDGDVRASAGFRDAYRLYCQGGWQGLHQPVEYGGQALPHTISAACQEMGNSANLSFALCPMLTDGAIEALLTAASAEMKQQWLPRLVSGEWTGTMNLTEPQAGSDLSLIRTRAEPAADGSYRLFGTKTFITWGEHDMAPNIVHLVLARLPDAPAGIKGLSLFVVPKYLVNDDGNPGARNDVRCTGIEHKLGIRASATCTMQFGEHGGAVGYLVGDPHRGLEYMFVMMNHARFAVGVEGVGLAERARQKAVAYAHQRVQGRPVDGSSDKAVPIIRHPDVKRMLLLMRALTEGCRALVIDTAAAHDRARHHADAAVRMENAACYEWMVPLVKGYVTEVAQEVALLGVQVHGGAGFIEETGAAQYYSDAKILSIYEGTTAMQANDLVSRKTVRDQGRFAGQQAMRIAATERALLASETAEAVAVAQVLAGARLGFVQAVDFIVAHHKTSPNAVYAGSVPFLMLAGNLFAGWQLARSLLASQQQLAQGLGDALGADFHRRKIATARFYADHVLSRAPALTHSIVHGHVAVDFFAPDDF